MGDRYSKNRDLHHHDLSTQAGPPVPPKEPTVTLANDISRLTPQLRQRRPMPPAKDSKPLPLPPNFRSWDGSYMAHHPSKPLPEPPIREADKALDYRTTLFWFAGFGVWFLLVVILLPIIMERDAMPGFNRFLRNCGKWVMGGQKGRA